MPHRPLRSLGRPAIGWVAAVLACAVPPAQAQGLPTDADMQDMVRVAYNHLGLFEYCLGKGFMVPADIDNMRSTMKIITRGLPVTAQAGAAEEAGRLGMVQGDQIIGLMDSSNPKRPEHVLAGQTMSLADNAKAQGVPERTLCEQMAAQVAPLK